MITGEFKHTYRLNNNPNKILEGFGKIISEDDNINMCGIVRNITKFEEQLSLNNIIQNNKVFTVFKCDNPDCNITYASQSIYELLGYNPQEIIGLNGLDLICKEDLIRIQNTIKEKNICEKIHYRRICKNGSIKWVECIHTLINNKEMIWIERDYTLEKKIEDELLKTKLYEEEKLKVLQNTAHSMGYIFEKWSSNPTDCKFSYYSPVSQIIWEIKENKATEDAMLLINQILPEYIDSFVNSVKESYKTLNEWNWTGGIKTPSGKIKFIKCQSKPYLDNTKEEKYVKWYGAVLDVTETNNSNLEYEKLIDRANAPIVGSDINLNITVWNNKLELLTGYSKEDTIGKYIIDFIIEDKKHEVYNILEETLKGNEKSNYELPFRTKDGNIIDLIINSTTRRDIQDNIIGVIGIGQDLTELKIKTQETHNSNLEYEKLINTANAPIVGSDINLNITVWNNKLELLTGYSKEDTIGKYIIDFIIEDKKHEVYNILEETLKGNEKSNYELPFRTKDGNIIDLIINSTTRRDIQDNIIGVIGIGQDFTELKIKTAEQIKLNEETKILHTAVSSCMHELKNPEHVVSMTLEELEDNIKTLENFNPGKSNTLSNTKRLYTFEHLLIELNNIPNKELILEMIYYNINEDSIYIKHICNELKNNIQTIRNCTDHKIKILANMLSITNLLKVNNYEINYNKL